MDKFLKKYSLPKQSYKASIILILTAEDFARKKKHYKPIFFMDIGKI